MDGKVPSSATTGFFQESPRLQGAFGDDDALKRAFKFYLPLDVQSSISDDLEKFSHLILSPKVLAWCADAERNPPHLRTWDSWGRRVDDLVTSEGWRSLQDLGIAEGMVALGHDPQYAQFGRVYQFLKYHIWSPASACVTCPSAMTDGAARLLHIQLQTGRLGDTQRRVFSDAFRSLTSRDPAAAKTSGQWMTERTGGSDVRETETQATSVPQSSHTASHLDADGAPLGPYSISGFKWFSSATDASVTVLLARERSGVISAFLAPVRRQAPSASPPTIPAIVLNGVTIQRLKSKLGTRALPTAELVLSDMRAWRVGKSGEGTKEISTILNITRLHNAITAVGFWGRGLAVSRAFSRVRKARGRLLMDTPAHVRTLAEQHVQYRAMMHLSFFNTALLGVMEHSRPLASSPVRPYPAAAFLDPITVPHLLRLLTPLAKMLTARAAIAGLAECMESLGGVGYLENEDVSMNVARLFRDANVLSIWEGTTNVLADDLIRIIKGPAGAAVLSSLDEVTERSLRHWRASWRLDWASVLAEKWRLLRGTIEDKSRDDLAINGRHVAADLGWVICAILLGEDALSDGDSASVEICTRWVLQASHGGDSRDLTWNERAKSDRNLVFGVDARGYARL